MSNTGTVQIVVLLSAALAIGLLTPTFIPAAASVNSHSLNINPSSPAFPIGNYTLTIITGLNGTTYRCDAIISQPTTSDSAGGPIYFSIGIVPGSCRPVNG